MKSIRILTLFFMSLVLFYSCGTETETEVDKEKPEIDLTITGAFPVNCDTLYFDEIFTLKALFTDNQELGSYSIDIHNNFDQHTHSTEVNECTLDEVKDADNPFTFINDYSLPDGLTEFTTNRSMEFISDDGNGGKYQEGDYHFFMSLTDKEGWSTQKGLSIKILNR